MSLIRVHPPFFVEGGGSVAGSRDPWGVGGVESSGLATGQNSHFNGREVAQPNRVAAGQAWDTGWREAWDAGWTSRDSG